MSSRFIASVSLKMLNMDKEFSFNFRRWHEAFLNTNTRRFKIQTSDMGQSLPPPTTTTTTTWRGLLVTLFELLTRTLFERHCVKSVQWHYLSVFSWLFVSVMFYLQSWPKVSGHFCVSGAFSNSHRSNPSPHPTNNVQRVYSAFFCEFQLCIGWGEAERQENFEKDALF